MLRNGYTFKQISDIMLKAGIKGCGEKILLPCGYIKCKDGIYCDKCVDDYYIKHLATVKKERITIGYCKDCGYKEVMDCRNICSCKGISEDTDWASDKQINESNKLVYSYFENGLFYVGDFFGCVHFKE